MSFEYEPRGRQRIPRLETAAIAHVGSLLLLSSWYFGGGSETSRLVLSCWGTLGIALTLAAVVKRRRGKTGDDLAFPIHWLWPILAFNALVLASCLNPSFTAKTLEGEALLAHTGAAHSALPSTAHVATSLRHLWLFDALYFSAFNLTLIRRRGALRKLLLFASANAVLLAIFGTLQKLMSDGLFFGAVKSPNTRYFATFVYGNHWAAFAVLLVAAAGGLLFRYHRRHRGSTSAQTNTVFGALALLLMAITPSIGGSRAGTLMMLVLLVAFGVQILLGQAQHRRKRGETRLVPIAGLVLGLVLAFGGAAWLGREALDERWRETKLQWQGEMLSGRRELYRDTWHLVGQQPVFGWGLGSFDKVFQLIRPRPLEANRQYERSYADAHSDWLQALAEVGSVGGVLLFLSVAGPLWSLRRASRRSAITTYLILGCALIALYALVEFPFGNPAVVLVWWTCFVSAVQYSRMQPPSRPPTNDRSPLVAA